MTKSTTKKATAAKTETKATAVKTETKAAAAKAETKTTAAKAETKTAAVKETAAAAEAVKPAEEKKAPVKKAPVKRTAKTAEVKVSASIQFAGKDYTVERLAEIAKDVWQYDLDQKPEDFKTVELYVKPEENQVYYVINGDVTGNFAI